MQACSVCRLDIEVTPTNKICKYCGVTNEPVAKDWIPWERDHAVMETLDQPVAEGKTKTLVAKVRIEPAKPAIHEPTQLEREAYERDRTVQTVKKTRGRRKQ